MTQRRILLALAVLVYALFSSPTPDAPGWAECAVLVLMATAALPWGARPARKSSAKSTPDAWLLPWTALLAYGATVPLAMGVLAGHAGGDILRDIVAFATLAIPVLYAPLFPPKDGQSQFWLTGMLAGAGVIFSLRYLQSAMSPLASFGPDPDFLYLANSPLVAFSGAWLLLQACYGEPKFWRALTMAALSVIPVLAMAGMMQRATLMLLAIAWAIFLVVTLIRQPRRAAIIAAIFATLLVIVWPMPVVMIAGLYDKTMTVGWNARGAELKALLEQGRGHPVKAVLGAGWGALVKSPAVGDMWVRFSHALLSSLWWKTGWLGLTLGIAALGTLIATAALRLKTDIVTLVALILPLLPALFLYGSYKSFCFGLLLLGLARLDTARLGRDWTKARAG